MTQLSIPSQKQSITLLKEYIKSESLRNHSIMVAEAMKGYAQHLEKSEACILKWWTAGLLHDLDWEKFPDEHPNKAIQDILPMHQYPVDIIQAIAAHAPERTGVKPQTDIERYLYACDELSGFINAVSLMRPTKFEGMTAKSVRKKLKDKKFAANVSREDIIHGAELIDKDLNNHINFLISIFQNVNFEEKI